YSGTMYSYLIVNSTYAREGYYIYNSNQVWVPLTLLNTYPINYKNYTYANLNYNPFFYPTLEIGAGQCASSNQYVQWVVARAYPPNGIMPTFSISLVPPTALVSVNNQTNLQFNVSLFSPQATNVSYYVYLNGSLILQNQTYVDAGQTLTILSFVPYVINSSGTYNLTVIANFTSLNMVTTYTQIFTITLFSNSNV
ncbi:MAG: hypothetical protein ACP5G1_04905, partial [Nanopusillaceae archaeon]